METIQNHLPELISFHEVARCGGFTQAADKLNLSKAQLSKHVARLETLLKAQLFIRTTRKISLTEEGKELLHFSEGIVRLSQEAAKNMEALTDREGGEIKMTAPGSLGDWFASPLLKLFREKMPELKIEIDSTNVKRNLIEDNYDFALRAMVETNPDLIARYIGHIRDVIVASPEFLKKAKVKEPSDMKLYPCLVNSHQKMWNTWKLQKGSQDVAIEVQGQYACSSYTTIRRMCLAGLGIARIPYYLVEADLKAGKLKDLFPEYKITTHPCYLVYPVRGYRSKKQKLARDIIWEWVKGQKEAFI